jgi:hypothetical protein
MIAGRGQRLGGLVRFLKFRPLRKAIQAEASLRSRLGNGQGMREIGAPAAMLRIAGHRCVALGAKRLHRFIITCNRFRVAVTKAPGMSPACVAAIFAPEPAARMLTA